MSEHKPLPVAGYTAQSDDSVAIVSANKALEEQVLRRLDELGAAVKFVTHPRHDPRWLAIARTHIEQGFMAMNRAIFQPKRSALPGDDPDPTPPVAVARDSQATRSSLETSRDALLRGAPAH